MWRSSLRAVPPWSEGSGVLSFTFVCVQPKAVLDTSDPAHSGPGQAELQVFVVRNSGILSVGGALMSAVMELFKTWVFRIQIQLSNHPTHPLTYPTIYPSTPTHPILCPSTHPPTHPQPSIHPSILSPIIYPPTHPPTHPSIHPSSPRPS